MKNDESSKEKKCLSNSFFKDNVVILHNTYLYTLLQSYINTFYVIRDTYSWLHEVSIFVYPRDTTLNSWDKLT